MFFYFLQSVVMWLDQQNCEAAITIVPPASVLWNDECNRFLKLCKLSYDNTVFIVSNTKMWQACKIFFSFWSYSDYQLNAYMSTHVVMLFTKIIWNNNDNDNNDGGGGKCWAKYAGNFNQVLFRTPCAILCFTLCTPCSVSIVCS